VRPIAPTVFGRDDAPLRRQYFPKGTSFGDVTPDHLAAVADSLNRRPRRTLGWRSPAEAYAETVAMTD